jgi:hypothetical protein
LLTEEGVTCLNRAAADKPPHSTTATKVSISANRLISLPAI